MVLEAEGKAEEAQKLMEKVVPERRWPAHRRHGSDDAVRDGRLS